jgi:hypothetical protein
MTRISRRDFARTAGAIAGAALLGKARADETKPAGPTPTPAAPATAAPAANAATAAARLAPASQAEAEARVQIIVARYGARLSATDRTDLLRMSTDVQQHLDKIRAYPLDWSDEPAHTFRAPRRRR